MTVSIKEVAKKAGVTISTVSRVFNHYPDVLPETREKVLRAAQQLNYVPNANARSLSAKKPPNLCLIASDVLNGDSRDSMLYLQMKGLLRFTMEHNLELALCNTDSREQSRYHFTDFCKLHAISAAIVTGVKTDDPYFLELMESGIPVVAIDIPLEGNHTGWVSIDNRKASEEAMNALYGLGLQNVLVLAGRQNAVVNDTRLCGVHAACTQAGLSLEHKILYADFNEEKAYEQTLSYLSCNPLPEAVFCFSDIMALGVLRALREKQISVPDQVSVLGFDGMPFCTLTTPTLSTVQQDMQKLGYEAASLAYDLMREVPLETHHRIVSHQVILRESVRANQS